MLVAIVDRLVLNIGSLHLMNKTPRQDICESDLSRRSINHPPHIHPSWNVEREFNGFNVIFTDAGPNEIQTVKWKAADFFIFSDTTTANVLFTITCVLEKMGEKCLRRVSYKVLFGWKFLRFFRLCSNLILIINILLHEIILLLTRDGISWN